MTHGSRVITESARGGGSAGEIFGWRASRRKNKSVGGGRRQEGHAPAAGDPGLSPRPSKEKGRDWPVAQFHVKQASSKCLGHAGQETEPYNALPPQWRGVGRLQPARTHAHPHTRALSRRCRPISPETLPGTGSGTTTA